MPIAATLTRRVRNSVPVPYVSRSGVMWPAPARLDPEAQMRAMGAVGTLYAIVNRTTTSTASAKWRLYQKARSGKPEDRIEVTRHAAVDLWERPNPWMPRQEFVEVFQQHLDLTGESEWVISTHPSAPTIPLELWPVRPDRIEPVPDADEFLSGWKYLSPDGRKIDLGLKDVIQLRMPNPLDPYRGLGPVQAMLVDIDSARYSAEWNRNFFRNSAEPGGIIEVEKRLSDAEFDEMTTRWSEQHKGVANAHRVAVIEQGKWVDRKYTMRDMQFAELRRVSRDIILEGFGFPKVMIGAVDDVNRANAEASEYIFARWIIVPRLDRIKGTLNHDLLPLFGPTAQNLEWDYDSPVPANVELENETLKIRVEAFVALITAGVHPNDAADVVGIPRLAMTLQPAVPIPAVATNGAMRMNGDGTRQVAYT